MRADQNVPVIWWGGDSVRWNHNLGQLKTDPWISGSHNALLKKKKKKVAQLEPTQEHFQSELAPAKWLVAKSFKGVF